MRILGLSAYYHDSAAALVDDGRIVAAAQEERFTRRRHDASFPHNALAYCLAEGRVAPRDVDRVVFYDKPLVKLERLLATFAATAPSSFGGFRHAMERWLGGKIDQRALIVRALAARDPSVDWERRLRFCEHHVSHAASAFYPSPFDEAAIVTADGVGEWTTTSIGHGRAGALRLLRELRFPHSLGLVYSAFTAHLGFRVNSGEYKVMGLAPYGEPRHVDAIREHVLDLRADGSFHVHARCFDFASPESLANARFHALFGPPRRADEPIAQRHCDLARSIQQVCEDAMLALAREALRLTGSRRLCLAGGVALNCVANGRIARETGADRLWIQPAAGDAGGALGAALYAHFAETAGAVRASGADTMAGSRLGPAFDDDAIARRLGEAGAVLERLPGPELVDRAARALATGRVVGWFQGRMEFGPRALGARSILADPRDPRMQSHLNRKIKQRESFRPFAPSVLAEHAASWFDVRDDSPYMLVVAGVAANRRVEPDDAERALAGLERLAARRSTIPAVTHVDGSARIQTVGAEAEPRYRALIERFFELTATPVLANTSFNVRGEPIVATPEDAFRCFMRTGIDALAIGDCWLDKERQTAPVAPLRPSEFPPD